VRDAVVEMELKKFLVFPTAEPNCYHFLALPD
jgi:hypothetical protein